MKKQNWLKHEEECFEYLVSEYSTGRVSFDIRGGSVSNESDIAVNVDGHPAFYIEAKMPGSQCGQFVLFPDEASGRFVYSLRNRSPKTAAVDAIMLAMDREFDKYKVPSTKELGLDKNLYVNWIVEYYASKGVRYFITRSNGFVIFPIERFGEYFDVSAVYRIKKSGSANPAQRDVEPIRRLLENDGLQYGNLHFYDGKLYVDIGCGRETFKIAGGSVDFFLRKERGGRYVVTKLSNTNNANVIFSISLKRGADVNDIHAFEKELSQY